MCKISRDFVNTKVKYSAIFTELSWIIFLFLVENIEAKWAKYQTYLMDDRQTNLNQWTYMHKKANMWILLSSIIS